MLLKVISKTKRKEKQMRLLMLGLDNSGKTTILKRFLKHNIDEVAPTLGFNIETITYEGYTLNIWDVGGQKTIRAFWRNYFEQTDGLIWVVDSCDKMRILDCKVELHKLLQEERLLGSTLMIFANKQDRTGALSCQEIAELLELNLIKTRHWRIFTCSAFDDEGLMDGIHWMVADISSRIYVL